MSTKKINEALGIDNVEDFLKDLDVGESKFEKQLKQNEQQIAEQIHDVDSKIAEYNNGQELEIADVGASLNEIKELISSSKQVIQHTLESIVTSELLDPEVLEAFAKLLESTKLQISEYVELYKMRLEFYDKIRLEMLKHENRKREMKYKHELDMEKLRMKEPTTEAQEIKTSFSQEDIVSMLHDSEKDESEKNENAS